MRLPRDRTHVLAVLAGLLLGALSLLLLGGNERRAAEATRTWDGAGGSVLDLGADAPPAGLDGRLVRVTGTTEVTRAARDPQFGITAGVPALLRRVEMMQWHESAFGGAEPAYEVRWLDHVEDSSRFRHSRGHTNPGTFPFDSRRFDAGEVRLGHFTLAPALLRAIPGTEPHAVRLGQLPPNLAVSLRQDGGGLATASDPAAPRVGDLRIHWSEVPNQALTVLALARHGRLEPAPGLPAPGFVLMLGDMSMMGLLPGQPRPPAHPWAMRVLAALLMLAAAALLLFGMDDRRRVDALAVVALAVLPLALSALAIWIGVRTGVVAACTLLVVAAAAVLVHHHRKGSI